MSDELMEELRRVYEDAYWGVAQSTFDTRDPQLVAVLAVARHSAERQRDSQIDHDDTVAPLWVDKK